jgi:hypothetical protein
MEWAVPAVVLFCVFSALAATVCALYALHHVLSLRIDVGALKNSTHNIQFVPAETPDFSSEKDLDDAYSKAERRDYDGVGSIHQNSEPLM